MGWTNDLESYGVREAPSQVPYLGIPSDTSRSRSRSRTRQSTPSKTKRSHREPERSRPTPSPVLCETPRASGEERCGRRAKQHVRAAPSAPVITLTDTGNTMTSHGTYHHDPEDHVSCEVGLTYENPQPVVRATQVIHSAAPLTSQSKTPLHVHRGHHHSHNEGITGRHSRKKHCSRSGSLRQREHSIRIDAPSHFSHSHRNHPSIQQELLQIQQEIDADYDEWAGGFSFQATQPTWAASHQYQQHQHLLRHACPPPLASFIGGFIVDSVLHNSFVP
ncbi:hypothetical protein M407DRAFT_30698 [Tulasnella calospora MUT 4182]|nr:hypothetical protein M407DRAFT_30698 [Tulasnella calospora MUT 4182]